jgi:hypothetical protein
MVDSLTDEASSAYDAAGGASQPDPGKLATPKDEEMRDSLTAIRNCHIDPTLERRVVRKLDSRVIPLLAGLCMF